MSISLKNRKNTMLRNEDHTSSLIHHGAETCRVDWDANTVTISLCGWDTMTTRGKINAFLVSKDIRAIGLTRKNGETILCRRFLPDVPMDSEDSFTIRMGSLDIVQ